MLPDIQDQRDERGLPIQRVGIKDVRLPLTIRQRDGQLQTVQATVTLTVDLAAHKKGTHMSRFVAVLHEWRTQEVDASSLRELLEAMKQRLGASYVDVILSFTYFVTKHAPVTGLASLLDYRVSLAAELDRHDQFRLLVGMEVPYTSLCPCSKEISDYGAHNQRGSLRVKLEVDPAHPALTLEDLGELLEAQSSCEVYPLLKRPDEKFVTEYAYDHPKFVEDILRDTVLALREDPRVGWFEAEIENYESIHNHNAYAYHNEAWVQDGPAQPLVAKLMVLEGAGR
ncbi:GTP cyclohydrolase FolE2 [Candidatus Hydrogenisulfobacillus filiaventi]|uniref:GTP cyclohydrolase FolE2 n=1 Tax=Candidatus Hydrogenisulfobacillus filiaventi TaxID=2707344 RepID=A0A6F8ZI91_9FIRM|nr:GTP cyclohydrolase FolE2 [Bacillota bacterium]CAB1129599.1 GTP cyclohydrolase FolE2 [Candidatus Hydrogenisulfobacillus filiaventi]